ncbi:hypothetical protein FS935_07710 [Metabacillus litoralis]|uniref:LiaI-LiaF-like transmembrane region domain-containing protein n=1 Tax=Metabacillus litoralis TaxID=152268 RepID=A0A5C6W0U6_9BACI|nr:DUF5668 domain-containing protein [Metabacillus litoralis]TXC91515.1 hypothetical protein FS935_07710 [Metabacillus litoralis]
MKNGKVIYGIFLVGIGILFSLQSIGLIDNFWSFSWPLLLLFVSIGFHLGFFLSGAKKQQAGLLVPGGILFVLSILFMFEEMTNWSFSEYTWPFYIFAVAIGLFELWLFGGREFGLLIPIFILFGLSFVFIIQNLFTFNVLSFWPAILIIVGLFLIFGRTSRTSKDI